MKRGLAAVLVFLATTVMAAPAPDYSGRWEITVREYGQINYYLPMTDGRLVVTQQDGRYSASFGRLSLAGTLEKDGLHLACRNGARPCGDLVLHVSSAGLTGSGALIGSDTSVRIPVTVTGKRPIARPATAMARSYDPGSFIPSFRRRCHR